jgi:methylated-DNA-protein-cysteine methyltransferase related protein
MGAADALSDSPRAQEVLRLVRLEPTGFVTTYGDLSPGSPRFAGAVMAACSDSQVPWHRVVRADGSLAKGERQRALLDAEGVPFRGRRVDMDTAWVDVGDLVDR